MPEYAERVELFHLLSLEGRLHILDELRYGDACVCHLQHKLKKPQAYVSQQLRILKDAGVVDAEREFIWVWPGGSDVGNVVYDVMPPPDATNTLIDPPHGKQMPDTACLRRTVASPWRRSPVTDVRHRQSFTLILDKPPPTVRRYSGNSSRTA